MKNRFIKIIILSLVAGIIFSGCGSSGGSDTKQNSDSNKSSDKIDAELFEADNNNPIDKAYDSYFKNAITTADINDVFAGYTGAWNEEFNNVLEILNEYTQDKIVNDVKADYEIKAKEAYDAELKDPTDSNDAVGSGTAYAANGAKSEVYKKAVYHLQNTYKELSGKDYEYKFNDKSEFWPDFKLKELNQTEINEIIDFTTATNLIEEYVDPKAEYGNTKASLIYVDSKQETIDGKLYLIVVFGEDTPEKFTATRHFAVSLDGSEIMEMDILKGGYKALWSK